jgi:hypothetical protein
MYIYIYIYIYIYPGGLRPDRRGQQADLRVVLVQAFSFTFFVCMHQMHGKFRHGSCSKMIIRIHFKSSFLIACVEALLTAVLSTEMLIWVSV